ncbi:MAG: hypothetical protein EX269_11000 [Acidimicrobiales bacterium]|nr:MAG: hypothetical protein EX269_11000 [Acidimicrobiales bacterium]
MTPPELNDPKLTELLELASAAVEVDPAAKALARTAMVAAFNDGAGDVAGSVRPPETTAHGPSGVAEIIRLAERPRSRPAWGLAAMGAAAAIVLVLVAVAVGDSREVVVTSPPETSAPAVFDETEAEATPLSSAGAGVVLTPDRYRSELTGAAIAFDLDKSYRLLDLGPGRIVLQRANDPDAGTITLAEAPGPVGATDLEQWAASNGLIADSFGTPTLGVEVPAYRLSGELGDCEFAEPCLDLIAPSQGEPVRTTAGASTLVIEIPLEGRSFFVVVADLTPSTQLQDSSFDLVRSLTISGAQPVG